jgi:hypothetical protein
MDAAFDRALKALVNIMAYLTRSLLLGAPVLIIGPFVDCFACWRFLLTARGLKYINDGNVNTSTEELRKSSYNITDVTFSFNSSIFSFASLL